MFRLDNADYVEILNNWIHHSGSENMTLWGCSYVTIRGNTFSHSTAHLAPLPWGGGEYQCLLWLGTTNNILIEYN
jgi:hypothetical protein